MDKIIYLAILVLYLCILLGVGFFFFKKNKNVSDYLLGGRNLNPWASALSAQASDMSGWLLMGLPGTAYVLYVGTAEAIWTAIGLAVGTYLNWLIVAKRLRLYTGAINAITIPDYFSARFNDKKGIIKVISSIFIAIFFTFYTASMFSAGAELFNSVFGIPYIWALIIGTFIIVAYTFMGGFLAVCWTDVIQGLLMFFALIITPIFAFFKLGGSEGLSSAMGAVDAVFSWIPKTEAGGVDVLLLISALAWGLGYFGQPHILPRFMGIKNPKDIRPARIIAMIWVIISLAMAVIVGFFGRFLYPGLANSETVFITMVQDLFPAVITGILLTAILSAIMSTADSQLLVASSAVSADLYKGVFKKEASEKSVMWISRISVIVISIIAALLVCVQEPTPGTLLAKINSSIFDLVSFAWAGFGAAFSMPILFSLFWRRATKAGILWGIICGGVTSVFWWLNSGGIFDVYEIVPGCIVSALIIIVVSLLTKPDAEVEAKFDEVKALAKK